MFPRGDRGLQQGDRAGPGCSRLRVPCRGALPPRRRRGALPRRLSSAARSCRGVREDPEMGGIATSTCTLAPDSVPDLSRVARLAQRGVSGTEEHPNYGPLVLAMGLTEYRGGRHEQAVEWLKRFVPGLTAPSGRPWLAPPWPWRLPTRPHRSGPRLTGLGIHHPRGEAEGLAMGRRLVLLDARRAPLPRGRGADGGGVGGGAGARATEPLGPRAARPVAACGRAPRQSQRPGCAGPPGSSPAAASTTPTGTTHGWCN